MRASFLFLVACLAGEVLWLISRVTGHQLTVKVIPAGVVTAARQVTLSPPIVARSPPPPAPPPTPPVATFLTPGVSDMMQ